MNSDNVPHEQQNTGLSARMKSLIPLTFRGQAMLFLFPMIIIISLVYTLESISTERKILKKEIIKKGETIAAIAARSAELPLLSENREQMRSSALMVMEIKDIAFISFHNKFSEILLHEGKKHSLKASLTIQHDRAITFSEHNEFFEFTVPVVTVKAAEELFLLEGAGSAPPVREQIGWIRIGLSKEVLSKTEQQIIVRGGILAVVFSTVGMLLVYLLITLATRPLYALINAVKEVREGEHPEVPVISPRSEIGQLTAEFNRMSRAIKDREEALQENVQKLEQTQIVLQDNVLALEMQIEAREAAERELAQTINALHDEIIERERGEKERVSLARAIEQAAEAIFMCDAQWLFTYVNPAFERICGYSREEVLGQSTSILRCDSLGPENYNQIREIIKRDNNWSGQLTTKRKDATNIEAEVTVSSVWNSKGGIINYVFILRDITRELRLEQELRQSQKMEAIGTLAGGIAHDFNNILTAIIGYTSLAQQKLTYVDTAAHDLERVLVACTRAKDLVSRILAFSRPDNQELVPVKLAEAVDEVLKLMRSSIPSTIEIYQHSSTPPRGDMVLADPTQIHQVLMNLCTNAAHAMRSKGGELSVTLSNVEADASLTALFPGLTPGPCVRLTVMDSGHGMEKAIMERIFDPYFTTKKVGEGSGIGLAVVQGIIKSMGGAISVYSEPGQGTNFHLFLPQYSGTSYNGNTSSDISCGGMERILFVDDEAVLAELGQELLESLGYTVTATQSSREALRIFHTDPKVFDLVITDMTMPGLTGKELARELMAVRPDIPVILCTGFSDRINEKQAKEAGIREYVMKPYAINSLDKSIRRALDPKSRFSSESPYPA